jgi:hypothetical protein
LERQADLRAALAQASQEREAYRQDVTAAEAAEAEAGAARAALADIQRTMEASRREAEAARAEILEAVREAYADPGQAAKAWAEYARQREHATRLAADAFRPESLGAIKGAVRAGFKDRQRKAALAALDRMKEAQKRFAAAAERAETAKQGLPKEQQRAQDSQARADRHRQTTGDKDQRQQRMTAHNDRVRGLAGQLAEVSKDIEAVREQRDQAKGRTRDRDRGRD